MTDYTKTTNFSVKDTLVTGDPAKIIRGSEFDTEFNALQVSIATKADLLTPVFQGDVTVNDGSFIGDLIGTADNSDRLGGISASGYLLNNGDAFGTLSGNSLAISGDIELGRRLEHRGDPDTYFEFPISNFINLVTGGFTRIQVSTSRIIANLPLNANSGVIGDLTGNVVGNVTGDSVTTDEVNLDAGFGSQAPIFGVRAWGSVLSTAGLEAGGNIASVTQGVTGVYNIRFKTPMPDGNYAVIVTLRKAAGFGDLVVTVNSRFTDVFTVQCFDVNTDVKTNSDFMFTVVR